MEALIARLKDRYGRKNWIIFLEELYYRYDDDQVSEIGAQLTYYLILAIFPFLIFFLNLLQFTPLADVDILKNLLSVLPKESQKLLYDLIKDIVTTSNITLLSLGALGAIWSASNGVLAVVKAVNRAYDLDEDRPYLKLRGLSIGLTILLFIVLIVALSIIVFGETIFKAIFHSYSDLSFFIWRLIRIFIPLLVMTLIFSILYKAAPSVKEGVSIKFKDTLYGSIFASIGLVLFSNIFSYYINNFGNYAKTYGSIGGIIILLIWLYVSSIVVVLGAEVNATLVSMKRDGLIE